MVPPAVERRNAIRVKVSGFSPRSSSARWATHRTRCCAKFGYGRIAMWSGSFASLLADGGAPISHLLSKRGAGVGEV
jgi:hypothetical protein